MIVLFDIDGTLTTGSGCGRASLERALDEHLGATGTLEGISLHGNIDWLIVRAVMHGRGRWPTDAAAQRELVDLVLTRYREIFESSVATAPYRPLPGAIESVMAARAGCEMVGLATGNMEACAHGKLRSAGLAGLFVDCVGGYGDQAETRADVVRLAIARARQRGARARDVLVVGDTPLDVHAAHAAGALAAGVATGSYSAAELAASGANHSFENLADLVRSPPWR